MSDVGVGLDIEVGFGLESTQNTRVAPDTFLRVPSEDLKMQLEHIKSKGLGGGRRLGRYKRPGKKTVGGPVGFEVGTTQLAEVLSLLTHLTPTASGTDPFTRSYAGVGSGIVSATIGVVRPFGGGEEYFEYEGSCCTKATLTQNAGEYLMCQAEFMCHDETTDQTKVTFAPPADEQLLSFQDVATSVFGTTECFDSFTLDINHNLDRTWKSCAADAGRAKIRHGGGEGSVITGTLNDDFKDMDHYNRYVAGTEGALIFTYTGENSSTLTITMNVYFTGETPNVSGPGVVKQGIPFEVISATSDANAFTVELVNGES